MDVSATSGKDLLQRGATNAARGHSAAHGTHNGRPRRWLVLVRRDGTPSQCANLVRSDESMNAFFNVRSSVAAMP